MRFVLVISVLAMGISVACSPSESATSRPAAAPSGSESTAPVATTQTRESPGCSLNVAQAPLVKGLKLGMTPDEVLALFPGSKEDAALKTKISSPPNRFGELSFVIQPHQYQTKPEFSDVNQVKVLLMDGRVWNFTVSYKGPQWKHVDEFVAKFIEGEQLPDASQWEAYAGLETQMKTLTCTDFSIRLFAGGEGGNLNYAQLQDLEADKKLKERRKKAREQASPTPGQ